MKNLRDLLEDQLKDIYSAENQVSKALPKMAQAASAAQLVTAFENHLKETQGQIGRLKEIASLMECELGGEKCDAAEGLIEEGEEIIEEHQKGPTRDAGLIAAAQRFEHYEMAAYGTAREFANQLGLKQVAKLLQETLDEEGECNKLLTKIALAGVNHDSAGATGIPTGKLQSMTVEELYDLAKEREISGRSDMSKKELIEALS